MANGVSYGMGQIRYSSTGEYLTNLNIKADYIKTNSVSNLHGYRDIILYGGGNFSALSSYYLRLGIPVNLAYNMVFDIKLYQTNSSATDNEFLGINDENQYQLISRIVVPRNNTANTSISRVVLYPINEEGQIDADGEPVVAIAKDDPDIISPNQVYYSSARHAYYIRQENGKDLEITLRNDALLNHSWKEAIGKEKKYFDIVFSNKVANSNFNCIKIEMNRIPEDDDISFEDNGIIYNGLHIDLPSGEEGEDPNTVFSADCYRIVNLIDNIAGVSKLNNIGVWSHPDAIMAINGEEIRVGQSGYYELNDFDITNFGIIVHYEENSIGGRINNINDRFSVDYQYKISS